MKGYINDLLDGFEEINSTKIVWINELVWITNYIKIINYSNEKVLLKTKSGILAIVGNGLYIQMMEKGEIILKGKIISVGYN